MLTRFLHSRYGWLILLLLLIAVNYIFSQFPFRVDLTAEKRYTISGPTRKMLEGLNDKVDVTVLMAGDLPAGFKKLAGSTSDMLDEFKAIGGNNISFRFERPGEGLDDTARMYLYDSLRSLGINPTNVKAQTKEGEGEDQRLVFPGAVVTYKDRSVGVDFLQGQNFEGGLSSLNNAEALLEYKLANSIHKITQDTIPLIGYLSGNGEPLDYRVYDLIENTLRANYAFRIIPIDSVAIIPPVFNALMIVTFIFSSVYIWDFINNLTSQANHDSSGTTIPIINVDALQVTGGTVGWTSEGIQIPRPLPTEIPNYPFFIFWLTIVGNLVLIALGLRKN